MNYFNSLSTYKFVISPEGIDCHRHYEALLARCVPIIEHNSLDQNFLSKKIQNINQKSI